MTGKLLRRNRYFHYVVEPLELHADTTPDKAKVVVLVGGELRAVSALLPREATVEIVCRQPEFLKRRRYSSIRKSYGNAEYY